MKLFTFAVVFALLTTATFAQAPSTVCYYCDNSPNEFNLCPPAGAGQSGFSSCHNNFTDCHDGTQGPCAPHCHVGSPCVGCADISPMNNVCDEDDPCPEWYQVRNSNGNCVCLDANQNGVCDFGPGGDDEEDIQDNGGTSPLLIVADGKWNKALSGLTDAPVVFDINNDGLLDTITWTEAHREVAFLALDRNGSGVIDNGSELFGDAKPWQFANGFEMLKTFAGDDGLVTSDDPIWSSLLLWTDRNHNAASEASELERITETDIVSLDTAYKEKDKTDPDGNWLRFRSQLKRSDGSKEKFYDVYFQRVTVSQ